MLTQKEILGYAIAGITRRIESEHNSAELTERIYGIEAKGTRAIIRELVEKQDEAIRMYLEIEKNEKET